MPSALRLGRARHLFIGLSCLVVVLTGCTATVDGTGSAIGGKASPGPGASSTPSGSGSATAPDPAPPKQPLADFVDCHKLFGVFRPGLIKFPAGRLAKLTFTCTIISVPLDYADPSGKTTQLGTLGQALTSGLKGDSVGLLALADSYNQRSADGTYSNIIDSGLAINCNDTAPGPSDATIAATATSWARRFPLFGPSAASGLYSCQQWQPDRTVPPLPTAATPHTVLVLGNLHDPATPYRGAIDLTRTMGHAELLSWNGEGHTSYLHGSSCVDNYVSRYLVSGALPPTNKTCPR